MEVKLSVDIRDPEAAVLNREDAQLDCLLILHTSLGKDHFVSVNGTWGKLSRFFVLDFVLIAIAIYKRSRAYMFRN